MTPLLAATLILVFAGKPVEIGMADLRSCHEEIERLLPRHASEQPGYLMKTLSDLVCVNRAPR